MTKKPKAGLTPKQRAFVSALPACKTQAEAAIKAGYSPKNPDQSAHQAIAAIEKKMPQAMADAGLTNEALIENYLVPLLKAEKLSLYGKVADGPTRLGALKLAGEWKCVVPKEPIQPQTVNQQFNINVKEVSEDDLRTIIRLAAGRASGAEVKGGTVRPVSRTVDDGGQ